MANKPATLCQLEKGKLVDTQNGFVDTFNWAVQSIANLKGGENCEVSWPTDDTPTIDCTATEGSGDSGGSGNTVEAVYDVIEDTQDDKDGITIQYTDDRADSFIPFPSLSGGGGNVDDVSIIPHSGTQINDKLKVEYADGTDKEENIPFDPAVAQISRQWVKSQYFHDREVLSCVMNRGGGSFQVPFDIRLSGASGTYGMSYNDASRWLLSSMPDTNLSVQFMQAGDDGVAIKLGVYYI